MVLEKSLGWHDTHIDKHATYTMLFMPVAFLIYYLALRDRKQQDGGLTLKQAIISGAIIGLVVMVLTPVTQYIVHTYLSSDYFTNAIAYAVENGHSTQAEAEAEAESYFNFKSCMMMSAFSALPEGVVTALIVGGLMVLFDKKT